VGVIDVQKKIFASKGAQLNTKEKEDLQDETLRGGKGESRGGKREGVRQGEPFNQSLNNIQLSEL